MIGLFKSKPKKEGERDEDLDVIDRSGQVPDVNGTMDNIEMALSAARAASAEREREQRRKEREREKEEEAQKEERRESRGCWC